MSILFSDEILTQLTSEMKNTQSDISVISAFCKENIIDFFEKNLPSSVNMKKLMVRFRLSDLLSGVTDFSLYQYCKKHNWKFYVNLDLHAKTYIFDQKRCVLGSANATNKGLGAIEKGNDEISCIIELDEIDRLKIDTLFSDAIVMTDDLYYKMEKELNGIHKSSKNLCEWSQDISTLFNPTITSLFTFEMPQSKAMDGDLSFLNVDIDQINVNNIATLFKSSKAYRWLRSILLSQENHEIYYGHLTVILHDALVNDPKPYRKDVKVLLSNLLSWCEHFALDSISIDTPNYSQRIKLK